MKPERLKNSIVGFLISCMFGLPCAFAQGSEQHDDVIRQFCTNIAEDIQERRYAAQLAELETLSAKVEERITEAETKSAELKEWIRQRKVFSDKATETIVSVYASMRPRSAAERMEVIDANLASAILMKLQTRSAAAILNEMTPEKAGEITDVMAAFAEDQSSKSGI